jgi:hypothetical protein
MAETLDGLAAGTDPATIAASVRPKTKALTDRFPIYA